MEKYQFIEIKREKKVTEQRELRCKYSIKDQKYKSLDI